MQVAYYLEAWRFAVNLGLNSNQQNVKSMCKT